ncbi:hypothetical protein M8J76_001336 [Diaphorina citri]|nr:hypothetical protein M8J76_001336 [Diaphorina citri]
MPPRKAERRPSSDASGGVRYKHHYLLPPNTQGLQESGRNVFPALTPTSPPEKRRDAKTNTAEPSRRKETTGMSGTPRGARGTVACHKCSAASSKR